ncbi:MAG: thiamine pyrophosphate-binding protein, partial [Pseudomonadota bacterium]
MKKAENAVSSDRLNARTGGQILIDQLRIHGTDLIFGVPGESYLAALDALHDEPSIKFIICRQEGGAVEGQALIGEELFDRIDRTLVLGCHHGRG